MFTFLILFHIFWLGLSSFRGLEENKTLLASYSTNAIIFLFTFSLHSSLYNFMFQFCVDQRRQLTTILWCCTSRRLSASFPRARWPTSASMSQPYLLRESLVILTSVKVTFVFLNWIVSVFLIHVCILYLCMNLYICVCIYAYLCG